MVDLHNSLKVIKPVDFHILCDSRVPLYQTLKETEIGSI